MTNRLLMPPKIFHGILTLSFFGVLLFLLTPTLFAQGPSVGIFYENWFDYNLAPNPCQGDGWYENIFQLPAGHGQVQSVVPNINGGGCYASVNTNTGLVHAKYLHHLGVDFVVFDETNFSKTETPANNPTYQASLDTINGLSQYTTKNIQAAYMLSITCWGEQCYSSNPLFANDTTERLTQNSYVLAHMQAIADQYTANPSRFFLVDGKPLLLVYINQGSNVYLYNPAGPQYKTAAFNGPGNITPTTTDWNPQITENGTAVNVRDFFSVRFAVVAASTFDYTSYGTNIWPFTCSGSDCTFSEVGYAGLYSPAWGNRSISNFDRLVGEATAASKPYIFIRSWNEFSSTDEYEGSTWTLEPNTELANYDGSPGANPWYFYNLVMQELNSVKGYQLISQNSGLCMDVIGASKSSGAGIQQYTCLGQSQTNQIWELVPQTAIPASGPLSYEVISKNSQMCLTVPGNSQSNNTLMQQAPCTGTSGQLWNLVVPSGAAYYELQPQSSSSSPQECLDVVGVSTQNGALLQQYQCLGASQTNQIWQILWNGTTEYTPPPVGQ